MNAKQPTFLPYLQMNAIKVSLASLAHLESFVYAHDKKHIATTRKIIENKEIEKAWKH